jgi:hypothetical protein
MTTRSLADIIRQRREYSTVVEYNRAKPAPGQMHNDAEANVLSPADEASLIDLSFHWGSVYDMAVLDGTWTAKSVADPQTVLSAPTADELRRMVRADYAGRPRVPMTPVTSHLSERMST